MIYIARRFVVPNFNGFCWAADSRDNVPILGNHGLIALAASAPWEEIAALHKAVHPNPGWQPELIAFAGAMTFPGEQPAALGQVFLPGDFFHRPALTKYPGGKHSAAGARKYQPLDDLSIGENMDGDRYWGKTEDSRYNKMLHDWYEPIEEAFAAVTSAIEGQLWCDWQRFPPRQQTLMQHWAAEAQARRGK